MQAAQNPVEGRASQPIRRPAARVSRSSALHQNAQPGARSLHCRGGAPSRKKTRNPQRYDYVLNGFSAKMSLEEAAILRQLRSVRRSTRTGPTSPAAMPAPNFLEQTRYGTAMPCRSCTENADRVCGWQSLIPASTSPIQVLRKHIWPPSLRKDTSALQTRPASYMQQ